MRGRSGPQPFGLHHPRAPRESLAHSRAHPLLAMAIPMRAMKAMKAQGLGGGWGFVPFTTNGSDILAHRTGLVSCVLYMECGRG